MRRKRIIRRAEARHRVQREFFARSEAAREAELQEWRDAVHAAARVLAIRLPEMAGDFAEVIFPPGPRRWWRLFTRPPAIVGWQVAAFKFWEPDPQGRAVPAYAPGTLWVDVHGAWIAEIGLAGWMVRQADPAHLADLVPGDVVVDALASGVPETAARYWIDTPEIPLEPE